MKKKLGPQQNEEYEATLKQVEEGLEKLNRSFANETPSLDWFREMVAMETVKNRRRWYKELGLFILMAITILTIVLYTLNELPVIFFLSQFVVTLFIFIYRHYKMQRR